MEILKKVLRYLMRYRFFILLSVFLAAFSAILMLYLPILAGRAIDLASGKGRVDFRGITKILERIAGIVIVASVSQWLMNAINNRITFRVVRDVRNDAFSHLQILPFEYIDGHPHGEVVSRVIADVDQFSDGMLMGFTQLFTGIVTIIGTLCFMFYLNVRVALLVVILTPLSLVVARVIAGRSFSLFRQQSEARAAQTGLVDEVIGNLTVVKAFEQETQMEERF
ncbi:MAG: ABC transporter ATP-binding protein, partial [Lachnospiraceae bacterium]|nr:ABC transporter ATP-binding protein [Lachnospiraceae bacterium]